MRMELFHFALEEERGNPALVVMKLLVDRCAGFAQLGGWFSQLWCNDRGE